MELTEKHERTMALDNAALLEVLEAMQAAGLFNPGSHNGDIAATESGE